MTVSPFPGLPSEAPAFLRLQELSDEEEALRSRLIGQLARAKKANLRQQAYYEGAKAVRDLGISIPPHLRDLEAVAGWPEIVVDVIDEREDWRGWLVPDDGLDLGLDVVARENHLAVEVGQAVLDSLIYGLGFLMVGTGDEGEPGVLVTAESTNRVTVTWNRRLRRPVDGLSEVYDQTGWLSGWRLYVPRQTITTERRGGRLVVADRDEHGRDRVPISVLMNRPRASREYGRSEITRAVRSLTDSGMRTLLGMEVAREFYQAPQRFLMGADESMFVDQDGNKKSQWDAVMGRILALPRDDNDNVPQAGSFAAVSPQPFSEQLRTYAQMISAVSGVPATHLGFTTDNPASADAIREANARLDKRAIRRQAQYDMGLVDLGETVVLWRDGELPPPGSIQSHWSDPSTPTPAAAADRAVKLIGAGVLPPDSEVTLEQLGFSGVDIQRIRADRRRSEGRQMLQGLAQAAAVARQDPAVVELNSRRGDQG